MKPHALLVSLFAAITLAACTHGSSKTPAFEDTAGAITRYVAAEDNDFADLKGELQRSYASSFYYRSREPLPGSTNCIVYVSAEAGDRFGGCTFVAKNLGEAGALYQKWLRNVQSALPHWTSANVGRPPAGDVAATIFTDPGQIHSVFIDIFGDSQSGYRVTTTFAKTSTLRS